MGYAVLTQIELDAIDLESITIVGNPINASPRPNLNGDLFILEGDQFSDYDRTGILAYLEANKAEWNRENNL